ncbi:MAG: transposase, partial [bacterium]|nr:transposase [bacterium]
MYYIVTMYIEQIPNRKSPPAILVRECYRENGAIKKRTLVNVTKWPQNVIDGLRLLLKGEKLVPVDSNFSIERSLPHGHVEAILGTIKKLNIDSIISSKPCRERDLALAMIAERLIHPCSKLATTRLWHTTTLAEELSVADADVDELYNAMDWLLARQKSIEKK